jgi:hypothetical protein
MAASDVGAAAGAGPARTTIGAGPATIVAAPTPIGAARHASDPAVGEGRPDSV